VIALIQVKYYLKACGNLFLNPDEAPINSIRIHNREHLDILTIKFFTLLFIGLAMPGRDKCVHANGLANIVAHGNVLHHFSLTRLNWCTNHDTATLCILKKGDNTIVYEVGHVGAEVLEHRN
jgi:hypothetical protein